MSRRLTHILDLLEGAVLLACRPISADRDVQIRTGGVVAVLKVSGSAAVQRSPEFLRDSAPAHPSPRPALLQTSRDGTIALRALHAADGGFRITRPPARSRGFERWYGTAMRSHGRHGCNSLA